MNKVEARKLQAIYDTVDLAFYVINRASNDLKKDIDKIFGTKEGLSWITNDTFVFKDDTFTYKNDDIKEYTIHLRAEDSKLIASCEEWCNVFGEPIEMELTSYIPNPYDHGSIKSIYRSKGEYHTHLHWNNSYFISYLPVKNKMEQAIIHYIIDNFNVERVRSRIGNLTREKTAKEFGVYKEVSENYCKVPHKKTSRRKGNKDE